MLTKEKENDEAFPGNKAIIHKMSWKNRIYCPPGGGWCAAQ